jgi:hypothetical protein
MIRVIETFSYLPQDVKVFLWIAFSALVGASLFILFLLSSRQVKNKLAQKENTFRARFQNSLNVILLMDSSEDEPMASVQFYQTQLVKDMGDSRIAKQVMVDQLIGLRKSLSGSSADGLTRVFRKMGLNIFSQQKMNKPRWSQKARGIFELAQMNEKESFEKIKPSLQSKNVTVREEAFMALVKLDNDTSLSFLNDYQAPLSHWMVMRIHQYLSNSDKRSLPDFSQWFAHPNLDVALFAIDMTRYFRQLSSAPKLVSLLRDQDKLKVTLAIEAIGDLEAFESANELINCISEYWDHQEISRRIAKTLGKIGHTRDHWKKMSLYLTHPSYVVRFEAAQAMHKVGGDALQNLNEMNSNLNGTLNSLIRHVEDPLLQS